MLSPQKLDALYERYGFTRKHADQDCRVYVLRKGYFHVAEVVPLRDHVDTSRVMESFSRGGYACRQQRFTTLTEAEEALFDGFFAVDESSRSAKQYCQRFGEGQSRHLGSPYQYIPGPFSEGRAGVTAGASIVDEIISLVSQNGPTLIVLEAAAGFGKTCTAFEVYRQLLESSRTHLPILAELSRNRQATVFKYVLLDEIDRNFHGLSSDLVKSEIKSGRLPLIVDGFDELLYKETNLPSPTERSDRFADVESMLDTIGELLQQDAKIILTSRKTAIFAGDEFHQWVSNRSSLFRVVRYQLERPSPKDWLGAERLGRLQEALPIGDLSNPVLLAFLRYLPESDFQRFCCNPDLLIEHYFDSLLRREQERQALRIDKNGQMKVFRTLARTMIELDFTSETRRFIRDIILERERGLITDALRGYLPQERPTEEQLADTLAGHALLDRVGSKDDTIGFINEFVLGSLVGDYICDEAPSPWIGDERWVSLAVTAYGSRSRGRRQALLAALRPMSELLDPQDQLMIEHDLAGRPSRNYTEVTFNGMTLYHFTLPEDVVFSDVVFLGCQFIDVTFTQKSLNRVGFLDCRFYDCKVREGGDVRTEVWFRGSHSEGLDVEAILTKELELLPGPSEDEVFERNVLEQFWAVGRASAAGRRALRTLPLGQPRSSYARIYDAVRRLIKRGIIREHGEYAELNFEKIAEIRRILGRD